jgi:hypothetical protein
MTVVLKSSKGLVGFCVVFAAIVFSCGDKKEKQFYYRAINDKDTAFLNFTKLEEFLQFPKTKSYIHFCVENNCLHDGLLSYATYTQLIKK